MSTITNNPKDTSELSDADHLAIAIGVPGILASLVAAVLLVAHQTVLGGAFEAISGLCLLGASWIEYRQYKDDKKQALLKSTSAANKVLQPEPKKVNTDELPWILQQKMRVKPDGFR